MAEILNEAAQWLERAGMPMWKNHELKAEGIAADVDAGIFFLAEYSGDRAGVLKFELADDAFWPEVRHQDAAYVHRLAIRRRYSGMGLSTFLLNWAVKRTHGLGRRYLRLDCEAARPRLRAFYESFGFRHHSDREVGPYFVSRYEYDVAKNTAIPPR